MESGACRGLGCSPEGPVSDGGLWVQGMVGCGGPVGPLLRGEVGSVGWTLGQDRGTVPAGSPCLCLRLLRSLTNLKRVIINAAHYLVLGDKDAYRHDPAAPFLGTVSSTLPHGSPCPSTLGHAGAAVPVPPGSTALPARSVLGGGLRKGSQPVPVFLGLAGRGGGHTLALTAPLPRMTRAPTRTPSRREQLSNWTPHPGRGCLPCSWGLWGRGGAVREVPGTL